jgi:PIN domain nuclease of toxin-antitoxin system
VGNVGFLLDTHCWVWWKTDWTQIPSPVRRRIGRDAARLYLSAATALEIAVKHRLGRLKLPISPADFIDGLTVEGAVELPIGTSHALRAGLLPAHHHDPFDHVLIAQAQLERLTLVTADPRILQYDVACLDARK